MVLEDVAEQEVALVLVHCNGTSWPKLMEVACVGAEKVTDGIGVGIGMGMGIGAV
jgi:hypothetical protein